MHHLYIWRNSLYVTGMNGFDWSGLGRALSLSHAMPHAAHVPFVKNEMRVC